MKPKRPSTAVEPATYRVRYHCTKCHRDFWGEFEKGQPAPLHTDCPVCEMRTGIKSRRAGPDV